ncbi:MAG TPA: hypothetical protein VHV30_06405 [Polyangiaceae bacterium]|nr:hypothetical protein [Polyangiaceae bacterium]
MRHARWFVAVFATVAVAVVPRPVRADGEGKSTWPQLGGHVGAVVPLVTVDSAGTQGIGDFVTVAIASGVTVKLGPQVAVDFEDVVGEPLKPKGGTTGLTIDPGVIYDPGPLALGVRLAVQVGAPANLGIIPLVHKGFSLGDASWFLEVDLPLADVDGSWTFTVALHTGVSF